MCNNRHNNCHRIYRRTSLNNRHRKCCPGTRNKTHTHENQIKEVNDKIGELNEKVQELDDVVSTLGTLSDKFTYFSDVISNLNNEKP